jgi:transcriptional regulator with XRE-family HTH domain
VAKSIEEILTPETGRILRQAREARGLSVSDVSARLRLHVHYITSMESGDLTPLPPGPYRRAFITEYARFLNIKLEDLLSKAAAPERSEGLISSAVSAVPGVAKKMTQSAVKTTESAFKKVEEGVKDAVEEITARDLWEEADEVRKERLGIKPRHEEEPRISIRKRNIPEPVTEEDAPPQTESRRSRRFQFDEKPAEQEYDSVQEVEEETGRPGLSRTTKLVVGLLVIIAAVIGYSIFTKKQQPVVLVPEEKIPATQPEQKPKPVVPVKRDSASASSAAVLPSDSLIFVITAKDSVWVSVSPDVGKGFRGKLVKGEVRRFSAKDKYFLYLGNQKAVAMTLAGKPIANLPTIPGSNIVVRNAVLTRDKISISQPESTPVREDQPTTKHKKDPPIRKQIPSVKPVLPR